MNISVIAFSIKNNKLHVALVQHDGVHMLPRGNLKPRELLDRGAQRIFRQASGIVLRSAYIEQLYTFDSSTSGATVSYFALIPRSISLAKSTATWFPVKKLPKILASNRNILRYAKKRLQWKFEYTNVAYSLLPKEFTLSELQTVYEIILERSLDKRNFRKKILSLHILKNTKRKSSGSSYRPALLYQFLQQKPVIVPIL